MTVSKTTGVGITNMQAMQAAPGAPSPQSLDYTVQNGGKAGIWMSGMAPAVDEATNRVFVVTGNGKGGPGINKDATPNRGKNNPLSSLMQAVSSWGVDPSTGSLTQLDWFQPYDFDTMNGELEPQHDP